jgi:formylglycine-generating enzyme required for sulfatase activity
MAKANIVVGAGILVVALAATAGHAFGAEPAVPPDNPKLNKEITLRFQNTPLSEVLQYIATQTGVKIELDEKAKARANEPVTIKQVAKASAALDFVLQNNQLKRENKKDKVLISFAEGASNKTKPIVDLGPTAMMDKTKTLDLGNGVELEVVLIPPGKFKMGSPAKEERIEEAQHDVVISKPFYMGKYPVTQAQYEAIMGCNPSKHKGDKNFPVETVSWDDANDFCKLVSQHAKCSKEPEQKWLVRLPTEAEWEYACRAGTTTTYYSGDKETDLELVGWYNNIKSDMCTHPVGQKKANAWGLYDMHGNVWEWCQDWYGDYLSDILTDPPGPAKGPGRVWRGGSWASDPQNCRCASRDRHNPGDRDDNAGFRMVVNASGM